MKKFQCYTAALILAATAVLSQAQDNSSEPLFSKQKESKVLSVDDAVNLAKENNISVKRSQITLDAAKRAKNHSWNSLSPTATVAASSSVPVDALSDSESKYTASMGLSATVTLGLSANLYTDMQSAKIAYESGKLTFDEAVKSVELSVRESFYGLLYEQENIELQKQNLENAKTQYQNNLAKYNQGRLSEIDVLSAEVDYKSKIPTVESAVTTFLNDLDTFKQMLGLMVDEKVELEGSLEELINLNEITVDMKSVQSPEIKALEYKIASAKNSVLSKRFSAFAPSISASLSLKDQSWYVGYDGTAPDPEKTTTLSLSASIPLDGILPWSERNDAIDTAKDSLEDLELQLRDEYINVHRTISSSLRSIKQSQESIRYKQTNVELAQKTREMTEEAYNRGTKDLLTLQNANTSLLNAQVALKSEILTLVKTILNLEQTMGVPFGTLGK